MIVCSNMLRPRILPSGNLFSIFVRSFSRTINTVDNRWIATKTSTINCVLVNIAEGTEPTNACSLAEDWKQQVNYVRCRYTIEFKNCCEGS